jgi:hypothetical protein
MGLLTGSACRDDADDPPAAGETEGDTDGSAGESGSGADDGSSDEPPAPLHRVGENGLRRLTVHEYDNSIEVLVGDDTRPARAFLPEDPRVPFDNDATEQVPSAALVDGAEALALDVAERLVEDPQRRVAVVGCEPSAPDDGVCLRPFVERLGRLALRRPLDEAEVDAALALQAIGVQAGDRWTTVESIVAAFLQHPAFLYRTELGAEQDGVFRLDPYETVSRLSFFLVGRTPTEAELDVAADIAAEARSMSADERADLARAMLDDPHARDQVDRFHALWLNYEVLPHEPDLSAAMRAETRALVEKIAFEDTAPWRRLFLADETFVDAALAEHYGLPAPADPDGGWVAYGDSGRGGLLSHGSFLANGGAFGDTSPVMRGLVVKTRLLCGAIGDPPDNVNADDEPPGEGLCKWDRSAPHREPECAVCHAQFDPLGWGLENYDALGVYRDEDDAGCDLDEHTEVDAPGVGTFRGPKELGELVAEGEALRSCVATQLYRFAFGRTDLGDADEAFVEALVEAADPDVALDELLLGIVTDDAFGFRKELTP